MLPLPSHLLNIDPEDVVREIESDPLSEFVWSFRPNVARVIRQPLSALRGRLSKPQSETCADRICSAH